MECLNYYKNFIRTFLLQNDVILTYTYYLENRLEISIMKIGLKFTYFRHFISEPYTVVLGGPDMHVDQGSTINLTCVSKFNPTPPGDVTWYLNGKVSTFVVDNGFSY